MPPRHAHCAATLLVSATLALGLVACAPRAARPALATPLTLAASPSEVIVAIGELAPNLDSPWAGYGKYRIGTIQNSTITLVAEDTTPSGEGQLDSPRELFCSASARDANTVLVCNPDDDTLLRFLSGRFRVVDEATGAAGG